jgi:hypothetical protein
MYLHEPCLARVDCGTPSGMCTPCLLACPVQIFASIGRTVFRDIGPTALAFRMIMKVGGLQVVQVVQHPLFANNLPAEGRFTPNQPLCTQLFAYEMMQPSTLDQGSTAPFAILSTARAITGQTSVHAAEEPRLPIENLRADAPGAAEPRCVLEGVRPLLMTFHCAGSGLQLLRLGSRSVWVNHS